MILERPADDFDAGAFQLRGQSRIVFAGAERECVVAGSELLNRLPHPTVSAAAPRIRQAVVDDQQPAGTAARPKHGRANPCQLEWHSRFAQPRFVPRDESPAVMRNQEISEIPRRRRGLLMAYARGGRDDHVQAKGTERHAEVGVFEIRRIVLLAEAPKALPRPSPDEQRTAGT